jgi:hypothetical protein
VPFGRRSGHEHLANHAGSDRGTDRRRPLQQDEPTLAPPASAQQFAGGGYPAATNSEDGLVQCSEPQAAGAA